MADRLNGELRERGWAECKYVVKREGYIEYRERWRAIEVLPHSETPSYWVDNRKGRVLVDVEWNAKDGNLDRDLAAYRAWYEDGLIDGAVIITKDRHHFLILRATYGQNTSMLPMKTCTTRRGAPRKRGRSVSANWPCHST